MKFDCYRKANLMRLLRSSTCLLSAFSVGAEVSPPLEVITALSPNVATMSPVSKSQNATVNSANTAQDISANRVNHPSTASGRQPVLPDQHVSTLVTTAMTPKQPPGT